MSGVGGLLWGLFAAVGAALAHPGPEGHVDPPAELTPAVASEAPGEWTLTVTGTLQVDLGGCVVDLPASAAAQGVIASWFRWSDPEAGTQIDGWHVPPALPEAAVDCMDNVLRAALGDEPAGHLVVEARPEGVTWTEGSAADEPVGLAEAAARCEHPGASIDLLLAANGRVVGAAVRLGASPEQLLASTCLVEAGQELAARSGDGPRRIEFRPASPPPLPDGPVTLSRAEASALRISRPTIRYPEGAKKHGIEGRVDLRMLVGENGRVVPRSRTECTPFSAATRLERRTRWHPRLCA